MTDTAIPKSSPCKIKVQIMCGDDIAMGPGKADLLEAIAREGSISAAGRSLGMSYRRTWLLVDTMNRCWESPLVETQQGGSKGGGARLTKQGQAILAWFRELQASVSHASDGPALHSLAAMLREAPKPPRCDA